MKIIIAPDSFKGSLSAIEAAKSIERGIHAASPEAETLIMPVADGGEGTIDAIACCVPAEFHKITVLGPMAEKAEAIYATVDNGKTAVIEMAQASGLTMVPKEKRNPLAATTCGTGQLIKDALDKGCKKILIGIGGSATNDGGAGMLAALGAVLKDEAGKQLGFGGAALANLAEIDLTHFDSRIFETEITVACDVNNPLLGKNGASYVYGPQKGGTEEMVEALDSALGRFKEISALKLGRDYSACPGSGAAGGLGFALLAYCRAEFSSGIDLVLDVCGFENALQNADLVITGEGRIDAQSARGKVLNGIGLRAKKLGVPVIAIGGSVCAGSEALLASGITAMFSIANGPLTLDYAMQNGQFLIEQISKNIMRVFAL